MFVSDLRPKTILTTSNLVFEIDGGKFRQAPELGRGAPRSFQASGTFPDAAWFSIEGPSEDGFATAAPVKAYHWVVDRWVATGTMHAGETLAGVSAWSDGRSLGLIKIGAFDVRFALVGGKGPVALPAPAGVKLETKAKPEAKPAEGSDASSGDAPDAEAQSDAAAAAAGAGAGPPEPVEESPTEAAEPATDTARCKSTVYLPNDSMRTLRAFEIR